jgi:NAD(P)-dependent dehydrogenase (short-subunit alcohol dehydrogenase family)
VTVNAICPGYVDSPLLTASIANIVEKTGRSVEDVKADLEAQNPQNRFLDASEIASLAVFLATDEARGINGQALSVCGGALNV